MVDEMLEEIGIAHKEIKFNKPPKETYAVWMEDIEAYGADDVNLYWKHFPTIELYAYSESESISSERKIEQYFNERGVAFKKQARFFIQEEQLYQTVYDFEYLSK